MHFCFQVKFLSRFQKYFQPPIFTRNLYLGLQKEHFCFKSAAVKKLGRQKLCPCQQIVWGKYFAAQRSFYHFHLNTGTVKKPFRFAKHCNKGRLPALIIFGFECRQKSKQLSWNLIFQLLDNRQCQDSISGLLNEKRKLCLCAIPPITPPPQTHNGNHRLTYVHSLSHLNIASKFMVGAVCTV